MKHQWKSLGPKDRQCTVCKIKQYRRGRMWHTFLQPMTDRCAGVEYVEPDDVTKLMNRLRSGPVSQTLHKRVMKRFVEK